MGARERPRYGPYALLITIDPASDAADSGLRLDTRPLNHTADCITIFHIQVAIKSLSVKLRMAGIQATVSPMALIPKPQFLISNAGLLPLPPCSSSGQEQQWQVLGTGCCGSLSDKHWNLRMVLLEPAKLAKIRSVGPLRSVRARPVKCRKHLHMSC
jgi:hypothetical protein